MMAVGIDDGHTQRPEAAAQVSIITASMFTLQKPRLPCTTRME